MITQNAKTKLNLPTFGCQKLKVGERYLKAIGTVGS